MLFPIPQVLDSDTVASAQKLIASLSWRDGTKTAGEIAKTVKRNLQADLTSPEGVKLKHVLEEVQAVIEP
jgi:PKHD-type hydroxylase